MNDKHTALISFAVTGWILVGFLLICLFINNNEDLLQRQEILENKLNEILGEK